MKTKVLVDSEDVADVVEGIALKRRVLGF